MTINQAVVFTKPVHHLNLGLSADLLAERARAFFPVHGFDFVQCRTVTGPELKACQIIRRHYQMYSKASYGEIDISSDGKERFKERFGSVWDDEMAAGRIMGNPELLTSRGIDAHQLFDLWDGADVGKIQTGLLMAWLEPLECYCINAFYPAMEANFYHPDTRMDYYVVEFDPAQVSWLRFRKEILGATNAAKAATDSFRGQLYADYRVDFPGRDNFVHGSAGPLEGMIERSIHEADFRLAENPVGRSLESAGITMERFAAWKDGQSNAALADLFDATEEKDTDDVLPLLNAVTW
ncbi:MAG: hypothetical protein JXR25_01015 [Pontiellaceae bacterium]|nr:hypothetical protein [Pontiellaceae bacterium]MBN2783379.1 hypothetical protein [Pontiellaceae bacterium]